MPDAHPATGTPRVDILRHTVGCSRDTPCRPGLDGLPTEIANGLRLWTLANQLPDGHGWPLRIDWPNVGITYWPDGPDRAGERGFTQTLIQVPRGRLWQALADVGALWCADPAHEHMGGVACTNRVDRAGEHITTWWESRHEIQSPGWRRVPFPDDQAPAVDFDTDGTLALAITTAVARAGQACEHPDPGMPIYTSDRACPTCSAVAVLDLLRTTLAVAPVAERLRPAGHWVVGHGAVPAGDPRAHLALPVHPGTT